MGNRHRPKKSLGQHFLVDGRIADRIVAVADIGRDDRILEIGPGRGILTERLADLAAEVVAVELDRELIGGLRVQFFNKPNVRILEGDILECDISDLFRGYSGIIKVVSNIPYNISTPIVELLNRFHTRIERSVLMMQKEVAKRLVASPGTKDYGLTTLNLALVADGQIAFDVKPGSFHPPPEVMSSIVELTYSREMKFPLSDHRVYHEITGAVFRKRRKMIRNSLVMWLAERGIEKDRAFALIELAGIDLKVRPETITAEEFVLLANIITHELEEGKRPSGGMS